MEPGDKHKNERMKKGGLDGEKVGETGKQQRQKCGNPKLNTDSTDDSIYIQLPGWKDLKSDRTR